MPPSLALRKARNSDTMTIGSAKKTNRGHYPEGFWNMRMPGVSTESFFMITHEVYSCRKAL
jgi:hypothetical protein